MPTAREDLFFQCRAAVMNVAIPQLMRMWRLHRETAVMPKTMHMERGFVENWGASNARGNETTKTERLGLRNRKRRFDNLRKTFVDNLYGA